MMANAGVKSSQAGTTLRSALARLSKKPKEAEEELSLHNIKLSDDVTGNIRPIADIVADLSSALNGLSQEEKLASAGKIFGTDALSGWLAVLGQGEEELRGFTKALEGADRLAKESARIQGDTLQGSFKRLQSAVEGVKIGLGETLGPGLKAFTTSLADNYMPMIDRGIMEVADFMASKIDETKERFNDLSLSLDWQYADSFTDKMSLAWDKMIVDPFND